MNFEENNNSKENALKYLEIRRVIIAIHIKTIEIDFNKFE